MKICIVGHGPSLKGAGLGKQIDSHDKVVRLKGSHTVLWTNDYGSRTDALCASTEIMGVFFKQEAEEYWAYPKNGDYDRRTAIMALEKLQKPIMIPLKFVNHWNTYFRQMGAKHPNVSTGMGAVLIAIHRWRPEKIVLAGFDTLMNPETEFSRHDSIPRSGFGPYPNHDWEKENKLIPILEQTYNLKIEELCTHQSLPLSSNG